MIKRLRVRKLGVTVTRAPPGTAPKTHPTPPPQNPFLHTPFCAMVWPLFEPWFRQGRARCPILLNPPRAGGGRGVPIWTFPTRAYLSRLRAKAWIGELSIQISVMTSSAPGPPFSLWTVSTVSTSHPSGWPLRSTRMTMGMPTPHRDPGAAAFRRRRRGIPL